MYQYSKNQKKKTLSHRFILDTTDSEEIKVNFPIPIRGNTILTGYRVQVKLDSVDPAYFNRYWINAEGFKGHHRFGGQNGHELIPFSDENPLICADRQIAVQTKTTIQGVEVEFEVKANGAVKPEIFVEVQLETRD